MELKESMLKPGSTPISGKVKSKISIEEHLILEGDIYEFDVFKSISRLIVIKIKTNNEEPYYIGIETFFEQFEILPNGLPLPMSEVEWKALLPKFQFRVWLLAKLSDTASAFQKDKLLFDMSYYQYLELI